MNANQIAGILRAVVPWFVVMIGKNWIPADALGPVTEVIINVVSTALAGVMAGWSVSSNSTTNTVARAASFDEVRGIVASPRLADNVLALNPKVVSSKARLAA